MISILIPTYNYNAFPLAKTLEDMALQINLPFEILCFDDGSNSVYNKENKLINTLTNSTFKAIPKRVGLANNRNNLANAAIYPYLLFIDGDSQITNKKYLKNYISAIKEDTEVIYGGRYHPDFVEHQRRLRWKYGKHHEDTAAKYRQKLKYKFVLFNNTLISKHTFTKITFNDTIVNYGHEDTVFAYNLSLIKANVSHIDNAVLHGDVDINSVFFYKMHKSIENLNYIYNNRLIDYDFIRFLKLFTTIKTYKLHYLFSLIHLTLYPILKWNLTSNQPSLKLFNLFRISYFCYINLKK